MIRPDKKQHMDSKLNRRLLIPAFLVILAGLSAAVIMAMVRSGGSPGVKETVPIVQKKQYVCSMHPQVIRDAPGECPICGMFLIEKVEVDRNTIDTTLAEAVMQVNKSVLAAATTVRPEISDLPLVIEAPGIINYDPRRIETVSARFGGLVERSFVKFQFQHIRKGQKIYNIYAPDIFTEKWNYVKLVQGYPDRDDLTKEALDWFDILGFSKGQIDSLKHSPKPDYHMAVYCNSEGYAVSKDFDPETYYFQAASEQKDPETFIAGAGTIGLNDGIVVETGTPLFRLIDIASLRADLKVKTEDSPLVRKGQKVIVSDAFDPGRSITAVVSQIEPLNGGLFQTVKVYITDKERRLVPGRKINAEIMAGKRSSMWLPSGAVVDLGSHRAAFVKENGKFVAKGVVTGIRSKDRIEILSGIDPDAEVAEKALLLVDSDSFIGLD